MTYHQATHADTVDALKTLQARLVDAANGYDEAARLSDKADVRAFLRRLSTEHRDEAATLSHLLLRRGEKPNEDGSWMTLVHDVVVNVRAMISGIDESSFHAVADGERSLRSLVEDALDEMQHDDPDRRVLLDLRDAFDRRIVDLETRAHD